MNLPTGSALLVPLSLVVIAAFLALLLFGLGILAVLAGRMLRGRGGEEGEGTGVLGCLGGCLSGLAVLVLALIGIVGTALLVALGAATLVLSLFAGSRVDVEWPERSGSIDLRDERPAIGPDHRDSTASHRADHMRLRFVVRGPVGGDLTELVERLTGDHSHLRVERGSDVRGPYAVYEFEVPLDPHDRRELEQLERELEDALDRDVELPDRASIEYLGASRDL